MQSLEEQISLLSKSANSIDALQKITDILRHQTIDNIVQIVNEAFQSFVILENWIWQTLSEPSDRWIKIDEYVRLVETLHQINLQLILVAEKLDNTQKIQLLVPREVRWIDEILNQISSNNETYLRIIGFWFDGLSYLGIEVIEIVTLPLVIHLNNRLSQEFLMTEQYKTFIKQITEMDPASTSVTHRQIFYLRTCDDIVRFLRDDYCRLIKIKSQQVELWSKEMRTCIAHLIAVVCAACWWGGQKAESIELVFPSNDTTYGQVLAMIHLITYQPFISGITECYYKDETILVDAGLIFLFGAVELQNLGCFINAETQLSNALLSIAQTARYDRTRLCAYGFLALILSDEQLKELKIADSLIQLYFYVLEQACKQPSRKWKKIPIVYLIKGFKSLSSNDSLQTYTAQLKKISLFIELCDEYPMVYDIIWALSFKPSIVEQLRSDETFLKKLNQIEQQTKEVYLQKIISGILWNLNSNRNQNDAKIDGVQTKYDLMISYSHRDKELCQRLYDDLINMGYRIWIDFNMMHGNMMDAMAEAIEQSKGILICMSEQYRRSNYCRAEAQYAFQKQLQIVPVLVQKHYKPDGWLSFLIGPLMYVDFTKYEYSKALEMLHKQIKRPEKNETILTKTKTSMPTISQLVINSQSTESVENWTEEQVQSWLINNDLPQIAQILRGVNGSSLTHVADFVIDADSQQVFNSMQRDCRQRTHEDLSLIEMSRFRSLIHKQQIGNRSNHRSSHPITDQQPAVKTRSTFCDIL